jgi:hypothetical protein
MIKTTYKMLGCGMYGVVDVPPEIFNRLSSKYIISHSGPTVKYMCANERERTHLENLGIDTKNVMCDWFKIILQEADNVQV